MTGHGTTDYWSADGIRAEAHRLRLGGTADLQAVLALVEGLAWLVKPRDERDREANPAPKQSGD